MAETMTMGAPFPGASGGSLASILSARRLTSFFEDAHRRVTAADAADNPVAAEKEELLSGLAALFGLMRMLRDRIEEEASEISEVDSISPEAEASWVAEARRWGENSRLIRSLASESRNIIEKHHQNDTDVTDIYTRLVDQMEDLADFAEDLAETMALAAHGPFRETVKKELESAGVA